MTDIVERLRIVAGMIAMGEKIAFNRDQALMVAAADEIERLRAAVLAEREACAKLVEKLSGADVIYPGGLHLISAAIRARTGKQEGE